MNFLLNLVLFLPAAGALLVLGLPSPRSEFIRRLSAFVLVLSLAASTCLAITFAPAQGMQFVTDVDWMKSPAVRYHVGIDGLNLLMVLLTTVLALISVLFSWNSIEDRIKEYHFFLLLLTSALTGVFVSLDLILFYVCWQTVLIAMYFLLGVWGQQDRIYAAQRFVLPMLAGSLPLLLAILWIYGRFGSVDYAVILTAIDNGTVTLGAREESLLFLAFFITFACMVPLFPFHSWLPETLSMAPEAVSALLAGVMLPMGAYGMVRYCLSLFPVASYELAPAINALALISILYGSLVALTQTNVKRLLAYSSLAPVGLIILGVFSFDHSSLQGALYQIVSHGLTIGVLLIIVGMLHARLQTNKLAELSRLASRLPMLCAGLLFVSLSSMGLPLLNNFVGDLLILVGVFRHSPALAATALLGILFSAVPMLAVVHRLYYGRAEPHLPNMGDLNRRERLILLPACALMLVMGVAPSLVLRPMESSVSELLGRIGQPTIEAKATPSRSPLAATAAVIEPIRGSR